MWLMRQLILALIIATGLATAESPQGIRMNGKIYIDAASGINTYLAGALAKKRVPLTVVADKAKADYAIETVAAQGSEATCMKFVNLGTEQVLFAYWVDPKNASHGHQAVADGFAAYLRATMRAAAGPGVIKALWSTAPAPEFDYK